MSDTSTQDYTSWLWILSVGWFRILSAGWFRVLRHKLIPGFEAQVGSGFEVQAGSGFKVGQIYSVNPDFVSPILLLQIIPGAKPYIP